MDRVEALMGQKTIRRAVALVLFLALLYVFRELAVLLLFFVTFERALGWSARTLSARTKWPRKRCVLVIVAALAAMLAGLAYFGIGKTIRAFAAMQEDFPEKLAELRANPLVVRLEEQVGGTDKIVHGAKEYAGNALAAATAVGKFIVHVIMGFVLALVYVLEEDELRAFWAKIDPRSLKGTLGRWLGHLADAVIVTVQLQLIVAAFNTLLTLPLLLALRIPNPGALMLLIFVSALVPVIGNIVSGVVLSLLAYQAQGWLGVGLFVGLTFILHKVESYYLSPRLTSRHVKIPGFLLIVALVLCENRLGFAGVFLAFPILFVAGRIRGEFVEEDSGSAEGSAFVLSDAQDQIPKGGT